MTDKETLREAVPSYRKAKAALEAAKCPTCMGLGTCDDASPHDISFNTWECRDCGGTGLRNENFIQPLIDAAIATMLERLRTDLDMAVDLIQEAKGYEGSSGGPVTDHLDAAETHIDRVLTAFQQENSDER